MAEDDELFDAEETTDRIIGLVAVSQTCDIVRRTGGRDYVAVCPMIEIPEEEQLSAIRKGRIPYLTGMENAGETAFADLRRIMSVHKDLMQKWQHQAGFSGEDGCLRFAAALERKFGQFAFPDDFDQAAKVFRERVWSRHAKPGSEVGKVYRSLIQIRFRAELNWTADKRTITIMAIMPERSMVERSVIRKELDCALGKIQWPDGFEWGDPNFILGTVKDLTAEDIVSSRRGDFDFLCY